MSAKVFSLQQLSLILYGLSFSPTCNFNLCDTIVDVNKFVRHLTVRKHFQGFPSRGIPGDASEVQTADNIQHISTAYGQSFSEQNAVCELQDLLAESRVDEEVNMADNFTTRNPGFYPCTYASSGSLPRIGGV